MYEKDGKKNKVYEVLVNTVEFADGKREANTNYESSAVKENTNESNTSFDDDGFMPMPDGEDLPF